MPVAGPEGVRPPLRFAWMGEAALLCDPSAGHLSDLLQQKIWTLADRAVALACVREVVPGMNNFLVVFDPCLVTREELERHLLDLWQDAGAERRAGKTHEIPVIYGGPGGEDLAFVARQCGLAIEEVVRRHAASDFMVYALGAHPGFGYLSGMDPSLATPRRAVPRTRVEAGSITIGGSQSGFVACTSPSGWHILGRSSVRFFDPAAQPPALLAPGDHVRIIIEDILP